MIKKFMTDEWRWKKLEFHVKLYIDTLIKTIFTNKYIVFKWGEKMAKEWVPTIKLRFTTNSSLDIACEEWPASFASWTAFILMYRVREPWRLGSVTLKIKETEKKRISCKGLAVAHFSLFSYFFWLCMRYMKSSIIHWSGAFLFIGAI